MEELFEVYKDLMVVHPNYTGYVCGFNPYHFILAVESEDTYFYESINHTIHIDPKYRDSKYRYICEDEFEILKQNRHVIMYPRTVTKV